MKKLAVIFLLSFTISCSPSYDPVQFKKTFTGTWLTSGKFDLDDNLYMEYFDEIKITFVGNYMSDGSLKIFDSKTDKLIASLNLKSNGTISIEDKEVWWKMNDFKVDNFSSKHPQFSEEFFKGDFRESLSEPWGSKIISYDENQIKFEDPETGDLELFTRS